MSTATLPDPAPETEDLEDARELDSIAGDAPPADPEKAVVATLVAKHAKGTKRLTVHGRSGKKYAFTYNGKHRRAALEFTSLADFSRVENDIREVRMHQHVIVTALGALNPVENALEAVRALTGPSLRVATDTREQALSEVAGIALSEVKRIRDARVSAPAPDPEPEPAQAPAIPTPEPVGLKESRWRDKETGAKADMGARDPSAPVAPTSTQAPPVAPGKHGHAELMEMPIADLRARAKALAEAKGQPALAGNASRTMAANFIMANQ